MLALEISVEVEKLGKTCGLNRKINIFFLKFLLNGHEKRVKTLLSIRIY